MNARGPKEGGLEPIIILGFGTAGKFENSGKIRTLADSVEALCYLVLTEVENQVLSATCR